MVIEKIRDGFEFVPMLYPFYRRDAIKVVVDSRAFEDYQEYIRKHGQIYNPILHQ